MRPVYEREGGRVARAGVRLAACGRVASLPFGQLLQELADRAERLRAMVALASGPKRYGIARAEGGTPVAGFAVQCTPPIERTGRVRIVLVANTVDGP